MTARLSDDAARGLAALPAAALMPEAAAFRDTLRPRAVTYSPKVFIPLTHLCRDSCHYCTFARPPRRGGPAYMTPEQVLAVAEAGRRAGCREALFTLGDRPETRYRAAREALRALGHDSTLGYLAEMCALVLRETGLLPHVNPGVMSDAEIAALRRVSASQGLMLESVSERLCARGGPHFGSPDKRPEVRLATIEAAGRLAVPFTSGILVGIGETRPERIEALLALRRLNETYGHIQEVIVQNFRAKPGTRMASAPEPDEEELLWTVAAARLILGAETTVQVPPNLNPGRAVRLIAAGIDDWGGVSPVTRDWVNPEAPWPELDALARETAAAGKVLAPRLAIHPAFARAPERWLDPALRPAVLALADGAGLAREDSWVTGRSESPPRHRAAPEAGRDAALDDVLARAAAGETLGEDEIVRLFEARGADFERVCAAADGLRAEACGETVSYVVTRNINYTNVCSYRCRFCAFSKGRLSMNLRGAPYDLALEEVARRAAEAWARGATEVCMQGGIHPDYTGATYLALLETVRRAAPQIHVHAFSPLEVWQGAATLGVSRRAFLAELKAAGLGSLPGTAAEILDDPVRAVICPDKLSTGQWLEVVATAHEVGLRTTATIMFGHVEGYASWARHLLRLRALQAETGGLTEIVPLPFVPFEAPIALKGAARRGPSFREAVLMHAVARLALNPLVANVQTSWTKLGTEGAAACLAAGANDLGGTLMNESISRAAGSDHGQELPPAAMEALIRRLGRTPRQRTTLYAEAPDERVAAAFAAAPLAATTDTPAMKYARAG